MIILLPIAIVLIIVGYCFSESNLQTGIPTIFIGISPIPAECPISSICTLLHPTHSCIPLNLSIVPTISLIIVRYYQAIWNPLI